jgi:hypothetical protein
MSDYTDEALWFGYAKAAMLIPSNCGDRMNRGLASASLVPAHAASDATAMLAEHRKRWPKVEAVNFPDGSIPRLCAADNATTTDRGNTDRPRDLYVNAPKSCETCRWQCGDDHCAVWISRVPSMVTGCSAHEPKE